MDEAVAGRMADVWRELRDRYPLLDRWSFIPLEKTRGSVPLFFGLFLAVLTTKKVLLVALFFPGVGKWRDLPRPCLDCRSSDVSLMISLGNMRSKHWSKNNEFACIQEGTFMRWWILAAAAGQISTLYARRFGKPDVSR